MRIFMHSLEDDSESTYYRNTLPIMHCYHELAKQGIELVSYQNLLDAGMADVFIFQKVIPESLMPLVSKLYNEGTKFVFQTDDNLWDLPFWHPVKLSYNDLEATTLSMDLVSEIITSTQPLADAIGKPDKTTVLPTLIDEACFHERSSDFDQYSMGEEQVKVLWAGSNRHDGDLEQIVNPVIKLIEKWGNKVQFIFFGYLPTGLADFVRMPGEATAYLKPKHAGNILFIPPMPFRMYYDVLMSIRPDIGISPLTDCNFNLSKSNIKFLEMTMSGAAFIGTDLPPYSCVDKTDPFATNGLLVKPDNEDGWFSALDNLIGDIGYRIVLRRMALDGIKEKFTWQSSARDLWLNKFFKLVEGLNSVEKK